MTAKTNIQVLLTTMAMILPILISCGSESYPGLDYDQEINISNNENNNATEVKVFLEEQKFFETNPVKNDNTRGIGVFENEKNENGNETRPIEDEQKFTFHVFAFHNGVDETTDLTQSFFKTSGGQRDIEHRHCLVDGYDRLGMPAKLNTNRNKELVFQYDRYYTEHPKILNYSNKKEYIDRAYNFFVYHIDDSETMTERTADKIVHHIEIDGSQDIMCGTSPVLNDEYLNKHFIDIKNDLDDAEYSRILNTRGFSTYSARHGIYPIVPLEHKLARLKFFLYPGSADCKYVNVTRISVELPYKGEFIVAGRYAEDMALTWNDKKESDRKELWIRKDTKKTDSAGDITNDTKTEDKEDVHTEDTGNYNDPYFLGLKLPWEDSYTNMPWKERKREEAGTGLLIPAVGKCTLRIYFTCSLPGFDDKEERVYQYSLPTDDQKIDFKPNNLYNINIAIYGPQKIEVNSNIDSWLFGGDISIGGE